MDVSRIVTNLVCPSVYPRSTSLIGYTPRNARGEAFKNAHQRLDQERRAIRSSGGDGDNLWLRYRNRDFHPRWFLRYSIGGRPRTLYLGSYRDISLAEARAHAKKLRAEIALGHDVARLKKDRVRAASERVLAERDGLTVGALADNFYDRYVAGRLKHPEIVRS